MGQIRPRKYGFQKSELELDGIPSEQKPTRGTFEPRDMLVISRIILVLGIQTRMYDDKLGSDGSSLQVPIKRSAVRRFSERINTVLHHTDL